jgi:putative DNA primase/helicase
VRIETLPASSVIATRLPMLWRSRIPAAALSVIAGKPGLGKSTLAMTIAAELSVRGLSVILSNLEDDASAVMRPRLDVAGADLDNVHLIPPTAAPLLPRDLPALAHLIKELRASCLIIDPVAAHFRPERRVHDRAVLSELMLIARETRCAIVAVHHTTKMSVDGTAIGAIGGPSGGLAGAARAAYLYGYDPDDQDRRALACVKINGVDEPPALLLSHETVDYKAGDQLIEAGLLRIVEEANVVAKDVLRPGRRRRNRDAECAEWLCLFLSAGEDCKRQVQEVRREGTAANFAWATLRRAATELKIERERVGWGGDGFWLWRLPESNPLRAEVVEPA